MCSIKYSIDAVSENIAKDLEDIKANFPQIIKIIDNLEKPIEKTVDDIDVSEILNNYGKKIVEKFPHINELLQHIDRELDPSIQRVVLSKLGEGVGRWQYNHNYQFGGLLPLDKTLQRMVWPSLQDFLSINAKDHIVEVYDCPHCAGRVDSGSNCLFISSYIQGFLNSLAHLPAISVIQLQSKSMGHGYCSFEVKEVNLN